MVAVVDVVCFSVFTFGIGTDASKDLVFGMAKVSVPFVFNLKLQLTRLLCVLCVVFVGVVRLVKEKLRSSRWVITWMKKACIIALLLQLFVIVVVVVVVRCL